MAAENEEKQDMLEEAADTGHDGDMPLMAHLEELRHRIIICLVAVAAGSGIAYYFLDTIMAYLIAPAGKLYFMQPAEAFFTYMKVTVFAGFIISLPVVFWEIWGFFLPALTRKERLLVGILVLFSVVLFVGGVLFSFTLVLPLGMTFFMGMGTENLQAMISMEKYIDFLLTLVLPFGFVFELPLAMIILAQLGLVTSAMMQKQFRLVIFITFIVGAILTPPDVFSQVMIALPVIALYGFSIFVVKYVLKK